jgi:hypothetical protein
MDKELQYSAMEKLLNTLVKPEFEKIIEDIKVVPSTMMSNTHPTVKVYLSPNLLHYVSVEYIYRSGVTSRDIERLTSTIHWKIKISLRLMGSPRFNIELIQIQP